MSIVISEVEHRPAPEDSGEGTQPATSAAPQAAALKIEQVLAALRREASRRSRLWAD